MNDYLLFMDVSGDLDPQFAIDHDIHLVPMQFIIGGEPKTYDYNDTDADFKDFYKAVKDEVSIKTTQVTPYAYEEIFGPYLAEGHSVLFLCLSSGLSSTVNSARQAALNLKEQYPDVDLVVIDSLNATAGMGLLAEQMAYNRENGMSIQENYERINYLRGCMRINTYVDNLTALKNGGRVSAATAFFGGMLDIKPLICINKEGGLDVWGKNRGVNKSIKVLMDYYREHHSDDPDSVVYLCDADEQKNTDEIERQILEINPNAIIKRRYLSPIIGAHLGHGAIAIGYWEKPAEEAPAAE